MLPVTPSAVSFVLSVILGSYFSKSFGRLSSGCLSSFILPTPLTTMRTLTGSPALTVFLSTEDDTVKCPTPPEKPAGLAGSGNTFIATLGALMLFFTSIYPEPPLKNASKGSTVVFCCITMPLNVRLGMVSFPDICGNMTY